MIATEWKEFKEIDWQQVYDSMAKPAFVFDGRLLIDAEELRKIGFHVSISHLTAMHRRTNNDPGHYNWTTCSGLREHSPLKLTRCAPFLR